MLRRGSALDDSFQWEVNLGSVTRFELSLVHEPPRPFAIRLDDGHHGEGLLARDGREGVPLQRRDAIAAHVHLLRDTERPNAVEPSSEARGH